MYTTGHSAVERINGTFFSIELVSILTLNLLTTTIVAPSSNASKWQMGINSVFKGLMYLYDIYTLVQTVKYLGSQYVIQHF